jgi:hypothetical protein
MTSVIINQGAAVYGEITYENALQCFNWFTEDLELGDKLTGTLSTECLAGRYTAIYKYEDRKCEVDFPGSDPELTAPADLLRSPRLYVDGNSWFYGYALRAAYRKLTGLEE